VVHLPEDDGVGYRQADGDKGRIAGR
jgi:hypothetical protein